MGPARRRLNAIAKWGSGNGFNCDCDCQTVAAIWHNSCGSHTRRQARRAEGSWGGKVICCQTEKEQSNCNYRKRSEAIHSEIRNMLIILIKLGLPKLTDRRQQKSRLQSGYTLENLIYMDLNQLQYKLRKGTM